MQTATPETPASATEGRLAWTAPTIDIQAAGKAEFGTFGQTDGGTGTS